MAFVSSRPERKFDEIVTPRAAMMTARMSSNGKLVHDLLEFSSSKSFFNRAKADSKASWSFQLEKSGMKYSRTSTAKSLPVSASKHVQSRKVSKSVSRMWQLWQ